MSSLPKELCELLHPSLVQLSLILISNDEQWFLVQRKGFDMFLNGQPYHAIQVNI